MPLPSSIVPVLHSSRVSADGQTLAFTSAAALSGADNLDAGSGQPDAQVFLYDATANGGAGELRCVSCNRGGARPLGRDVGAGHTTLWVASTLPGWPDQFRPGGILSADGSRLFFESFDSLAPADTNQKQDVYEWEALGSGNCAAAEPSYDPAAGGCVSLISTGKDSHDSDLLDASADGRDVFIRTAEQLLATDSDDVTDVYDARSGGGIAVHQSPSPCDLGAGACEGQGSSAPNVPGAGSAAFQGPANPPAKFKKAKKHTKHKKKRHKPRKHKHRHHKAKKRHHRRAHRRRAGR